MIAWDDFKNAVVNTLNRDIDSNINQSFAINAPLKDSLLLLPDRAVVRLPLWS